MELKALQNGSDIRGIALAHEEMTVTLGAKEARQIASGLISWLTQQEALAEKLEKQQVTIGIGHDSRLSAQSLKKAFIEQLTQYGVQVIDFGLATTPAMFMATQFPQYKCDATLMLTASHLPYYFNGIKIFTQRGGAEKADIAYILANTDFKHEAKTVGHVTKASIIPEYADDLVQKIRRGMQTTAEKPLAGFKIIVDAGNGAGGFFAEKVLAVLGADTTGSQFLEPDGTFPNHIPNPDNKEAMASIQDAVLKNQADLGVIFDTDVDRSAVVDAAGQVINRNNLIAVLATIVLQEQPGSAIVTNSPTSDHLKTFIEAQGGQQVRYISGYRNVINKMIQLNEQGCVTPLAIETSGHAAFAENYHLDDGAYVIAKILMLLPKLKAQGQSLSQLIAELKQPAETQEIRFLIEADEVWAYGQQVIADLEQFAQVNDGFTIDKENHEGIRLTVGEPYGSGWLLLRLSLHEPLLVLQFENDERGQNRKVAEKLAVFFEAYEQLNLSALKNYLHA